MHISGVSCHPWGPNGWPPTVRSSDICISHWLQFRRGARRSWKTPPWRQPRRQGQQPGGIRLSTAHRLDGDTGRQQTPPVFRPLRRARARPDIADDLVEGLHQTSRDRMLKDTRTVSGYRAQVPHSRSRPARGHRGPLRQVKNVHTTPHAPGPAERLRRQPDPSGRPPHSCRSSDALDETPPHRADWSMHLRVTLMTLIPDGEPVHGPQIHRLRFCTVPALR